MNKLLVFLLSLCVTSLEAATITNWGAQLPTAVPASGDVILMQKGGVTYNLTPLQLAQYLSTNEALRGSAPPSSIVHNSNGVLRGNSAFVFTNDNVGIGTNKPSATLDIVTTNHSPFRVTVGGTNLLMDFGKDPLLTGGLDMMRIYHAGPNPHSNFFWIADLGDIGLGQTPDLQAITVGLCRTIYAGQFMANLMIDQTNVQWVVQNTNRVATMVECGQEGITLHTTPIGTRNWSNVNHTSFRVMPSGDTIAFHKLGVGTSTPRAKVDIVTSTLRRLRFDEDSAAQPMIRATASTDTLRALRLDAFTIQLSTADSAETNGVERMRIDSNGNVGIGIEVPLAALSISNATATTPLLRIMASNNPTPVVMVNSNGYFGTWTAAPSTPLDIATSTGRRLKFDEVALQPRIRATASTDTLRAMILDAYTIQLSTADASETNGVERMRIDSNGNVGIGLTVPTAILTVSNATATTPLFQVFASNNPVAVVTVASNSFVGIGTHAPSVPLDVAVSAARRLKVDLDSLTQPRIRAAASTDTLRALRLEGLTIQLATDSSAVTNGVERMRIGSDGKVGIGTLAPSSSLDVTGQVNSASAIFTNSVTVVGTTNQLIFGNTNPAPASAVAPTKWISVQITGEATLYRLPLYE